MSLNGLKVQTFEKFTGKCVVVAPLAVSSVLVRLKYSIKYALRDLCKVNKEKVGKQKELKGKPK